MTSGPGPTAERFVNFDTGQPQALRDTVNSGATASAFGVVKPDGTTITVSGGVISAVAQSFPSVTNDIQAFLDGGGSVLATALIMWVHIPVAMTIAAWHVLADQSGSVNVDIVRSTTGAGLPVTSIVGAGNAPALSSSITAQAVPSGWTSTSLNAGDWVGFKVTSVTSVTKLNVTLTATRSVP